MKNLSTGWMMIVSLLAAGAALNVGCSSSDGATDAGGTGGKATGGGTGSGGSTGTGGAVTHLLSYTFDSSVQMWSFDTYPATNERNLGAPQPTDGGVDAQVFDGGVVTPPLLSADTVVGDPAAGSLKVSVVFTSCDQYVDPVVAIAPSLNLTGKTIHARIQQTSGAFSGGAQLHASSGTAYVYVAAPITLPTTPGTFAAASLDLTTAMATPPAVFDPTAIVQVGIKIFSGYSCIAPYPNAGVPVVFNIDTVTD